MKLKPYDILQKGDFLYFEDGDYVLVHNSAGKTVHQVVEGGSITHVARKETKMKYEIKTATLQYIEDDNGERCFYVHEKGDFIFSVENIKSLYDRLVKLGHITPPDPITTAQEAVFEAMDKLWPDYRLGDRKRDIKAAFAELREALK